MTTTWSPDSAATSAAGVRPPRIFRVIETTALFLCVGFELRLAHHVAEGIAAHGISALSALGLVLLGYLSADFIAGLVHFIGDSFGTVDMPVLGSTFILPFRLHHDVPNKIRSNDFVETNGNNAFAALFVLIPTVLFVPVREGGVALGSGLYVLVLTALVSITNQIHKWAHMAAPPAPVRALQRAGIILSPRRHGPHHRAPHRQGYCVTVGLFNLVLDPIGFFPWLERVIRRVLGLAPSAASGPAANVHDASTFSGPVAEVRAPAPLPSPARDEMRST